MDIKSLSKDSQKLFKELTKILKDADILTPKDRLALQMIVITYENYKIATEDIVTNGHTITITNYKGETVRRPSPFVHKQLDAQIQLTKLLNDFYLTPRSRNKKAESDDKKNQPSPMDRLFGVIEKRTNAKAR